MFGLVLAISIVLGHTQSDCRHAKRIPVISGMHVTLAEIYEVEQMIGRVVDVGKKPLKDVYVELIKVSDQRKSRLRRICITGNSGGFAFPKLKPGEYELRFHKEGHDITTVRVTIKKPSQEQPNKQRIVVMLYEGG